MRHELKNMWVCKGEGLLPHHGTIAYTRKQSIENLEKGTGDSWKIWKKYGWKCLKVNITIREVQL